MKYLLVIISFSMSSFLCSQDCSYTFYGEVIDLHLNEGLNGAKILIDPKATMFLLGSVMDYKQDKLASRFVFDNPNEKSTCGCGESFSI